MEKIEQLRGLYAKSVKSYEDFIKVDKQARRAFKKIYGFLPEDHNEANDNWDIGIFLEQDPKAIEKVIKVSE